VGRWPIAGLVLAGIVGLAACGGSKKAAKLPTLPDRAGGPALLAAQVRAARHSSPNFKIFPLHPSSVACRVPHGGPYAPGRMWLPGICTTRLRHRGRSTVEVAFTERWRYPAKTGRWWRTTWRVVVDPAGRVVSTRSHGAAPPQSWV
jgi:hypothetical protein